MFVEFGTTTNFSFLRGASHPEELVAMASGFALPALGIADRNSLAGVVRAYIQARKPMDHPVQLVVGTRLVFADGTPDILAYPVDRVAYGRLTRLLTIGNRRAEKGACVLTLADLLDWIDGLQLIVMDRSSATDEETMIHPAPPVGEEGRKDHAGSPKDSPSPVKREKGSTGPPFTSPRHSHPPTTTLPHSPTKPPSCAASPVPRRAASGSRRP